jgi:hypothetical protein
MSQIHPDPDDALQIITTCTENRHRTWNKCVCSVTVIASTFPWSQSGNRLGLGCLGTWADTSWCQKHILFACLCVWWSLSTHSLKFKPPNGILFWPFTMSIWLFVYNYVFVVALRFGSRSIYAYGSLLAELVRNLKDGLKFLNHFRTWSVENG